MGRRTQAAWVQPIGANFGCESATHKVILTEVGEVDDAVLGWLRTADAGVG